MVLVVSSAVGSVAISGGAHANCVYSITGSTVGFFAMNVSLLENGSLFVNNSVISNTTTLGNTYGANASALLVGSAFQGGVTLNGTIASGGVVEFNGSQFRQTSPSGNLLTVPAVFGNGSLTATLLVRNCDFLSEGSGGCIFFASNAMQGAGISLIGNQMSSATGTSVVFVNSINSNQYVELWGNTIKSGSLVIVVSASLSFLSIVNNELDSAIITGSTPIVGGNRVVACNTDSLLSALVLNGPGVGSGLCLGSTTVGRCMGTLPTPANTPGSLIVPTGFLDCALCDRPNANNAHRQLS